MTLRALGAVCALGLPMLAGCGQTEAPYSAGATSECVDAHVGAATIDYLGGDRLSKEAPGGSYRIILDHNNAVLEFWGSAKAAQDAVDELNRIATAARSNAASRFMHTRNVSIEWDNTPARSDSASITHCLSSS